MAFSAASFRRCKRKLVAAQIDARFFLEFGGQEIEQAHVEIFAAQERVAVGGFDFKHAVADFQNGDVERAAAQIIDRDGFGLAAMLLSRP